MRERFEIINCKMKCVSHSLGSPYKLGRLLLFDVILVGIVSMSSVALFLSYGYNVLLAMERSKHIFSL
jgi:hypothetical protein